MGHVGPTATRSHLNFIYTASVIAEIIAVGSETAHALPAGHQLALSHRATQCLGVEVGFKTIVGDTLKDIVRVTTTALARADILILSGGLGPPKMT